MAFDNKIKFVIEYTRHYEKGSDRDWNPDLIHGRAPPYIYCLCGFFMRVVCHVFMSEACGQLRLAVSCVAVVPTRSASLTPLERVRGSSNLFTQEFRYANPKNDRYPPPSQSVL